MKNKFIILLIEFCLYTPFRLMNLIGGMKNQKHTMFMKHNVSANCLEGLNIMMVNHDSNEW